MVIDRRAIRKGLRVIATKDCDVAQALTRIGYPEPRIRPVGFEALLSIIVSQQISTGAAQSIMDRVRALLPEISAPRHWHCPMAPCVKPDCRAAKWNM